MNTTKMLSALISPVHRSRAAALAAMQWEGYLRIRQGMRGAYTNLAPRWNDRYCRLQLLDAASTFAKRKKKNPEKALMRPRNQR